MSVEEFYEQTGGCYCSVLQRLPTPELVAAFVNKFLDDRTYGELMQAVESGSIDECFEQAHKLKGVAANMGFLSLESAVADLVEQLRPRSRSADMTLVRLVSERYERIVECAAEIE